MILKSDLTYSWGLITDFKTFVRIKMGKTEWKNYFELLALVNQNKRYNSNVRNNTVCCTA